jgi:N-acetylneuraminate synthase
MSFFEQLTSTAPGGVYAIAEGCDNHMGSLDMAIALVDAAQSAGADAIKFQHHLAYEEMLRDAPMSDNFAEPLFDFLERNALDLDEHEKLARYCIERKITYLCTPFSLKAAHEVAHLVPFFKIGSGEFQDHWFIDGLARIGKPVLFSSGMCTWEELQANVAYLHATGLDFAVLNCLSEYPPRYEDMNLRLVEKMVAEFPGVVIGHSDHTPDVHTSIVAVALGARIIEKHITVSPFVPGPDKSVSITPEVFGRMVQGLRYIRATMGSTKKVQEREEAVRTWAYRSVIATRALPEGHVLTEDDLCTKRPGTGILSIDYKRVIGKKTRRAIDANEPITWEALYE